MIWDEDNELEEFKRRELAVAINFQSNLADDHELRLKLESVALQATALTEYAADNGGLLTINDEPPDSFSLSEFAVQIRYRYQISQLSELFIVYSRGGEFEEEALGLSTRRLFNRAIEFDDTENLMLKLRMHF